MKHRTLSALALLGISLTTAAVWSERSKAEGDKAERPAAGDGKEDDDEKSWMKSKLASSQKILADLTNGDLEAVAVDAKRMQVMNLLEDWLTASELKDTSAYREQLNTFEFATKELSRHADDADLDGALESYVKMTRTCVQCHKLIRDVPERK
jgi:hypothetical protein